MKTIKYILIAIMLFNFQTAKAETSEESSAKVEVIVEEKVQEKGITDPKIMGALKEVSLEDFVHDLDYDRLAAGEAIPIGHGEFIFPPHVYADMLMHADVLPEDRILDLGTGTGYFAAVLSKLGKDVYTLEILEPLAEKAKQNLAEMGYTNVIAEQGDGMLGMKEKAPFDKIFISFPVEEVPQVLVDQLKQGGRIIMIAPGTEKVMGYIKSDQGLIKIQP